MDSTRYPLSSASPIPTGCGESTGLEQLVASLRAACAGAAAQGSQSAGSLGGFEELCLRYRRHLAGEAEQLAAFLENKDWRRLHERAHRIAGTAGCYGLIAIAQMAREVEQAAAPGKTSPGAICQTRWTVQDPGLPVEPRPAAAEADEDCG